jgi:MerR family transcriptional regulator/heat shock protein HspR
MPHRAAISHEPVYTVGVAARKLELSVHALRLYEREGLVRPFRTDTNRRLYSDVDLQKIRTIQQMIHGQGLNFEGIRRLYGLVPCYRITKCDPQRRQECPRYLDKSKPCWASDGCCQADPNACQACQVYLSVFSCDDVLRLTAH